MEARFVSASLSGLTPSSLEALFSGLRLPKTAREITESLVGMCHHLDELTHEIFPKRAIDLQRKLADTLTGHHVSFRRIYGPLSEEFPSARKLSVSNTDVRMTVSRLGQTMSVGLVSKSDHIMTLRSNAFYLSGSGSQQILFHQPTEFDAAREIGTLTLSY